CRRRPSPPSRYAAGRGSSLRLRRVTANAYRRAERAPLKWPFPSGEIAAHLEVPGLLAILHRGLGHAVVGPRLAALGDPRRRDLDDDLLERRGLGEHTPGTAHVTDRAVADGLREHLLAVDQLGAIAPRVEHAVAPEDLTFVREVDRGHLEALGVDVLPHVELGPVG